jgi:hypothetical protein
MLNIIRSLPLLVFTVAILCGCRPSVEMGILGSWDAPAIDASNRITFNPDHTFDGVSDGMAGALPLKGTWSISGNQLLIAYEGKKPISATITKITSDEMTLEDAEGNRPFPWKRVR